MYVRSAFALANSGALSLMKSMAFCAWSSLITEPLVVVRVALVDTLVLVLLSTVLVDS
jgi:hypothetical protein